MDLEATESQIVEWDNVEKSKFYPLVIGNIIILRGMIYPLNNVRTRMFLQRGKDVYKGTFDAILKIAKTEGFRGFYGGFFVNSLQAVNSLVYITTLESVKQNLKKRFTPLTNKYQYVSPFVAGFCASLTAQTLSVPFDVISQHLMIKGHKKLEHINIPESTKQRVFGAETYVIKEIYRKNGLKGFYKGYPISVGVFGLNSAIWWPFYEFYVRLLDPSLSDKLPGFLVHGIAASMGGVSTAMLTNAPELVRVKMQVGGKRFRYTCTSLWRQEGVSMLWKGLTARVLSSVVFSFFMMMTYSSIKKWSLKEEYKDRKFL